jgi:hypothetical protein
VYAESSSETTMSLTTTLRKPINRLSGQQTLLLGEATSRHMNDPPALQHDMLRWLCEKG